MAHPRFCFYIFSSFHNVSSALTTCTADANKAAVTRLVAPWPLSIGLDRPRSDSPARGRCIRSGIKPESIPSNFHAPIVELTCRTIHINRNLLVITQLPVRLSRQLSNRGIINKWKTKLGKVTIILLKGRQQLHQRNINTSCSSTRIISITNTNMASSSSITSLV